MSHNAYLDYAIQVLGELFDAQLKGKELPKPSVAIVTEQLVTKFGISTDEANDIASQAFNHWVNVYYPN